MLKTIVISSAVLIALDALFLNVMAKPLQSNVFQVQGSPLRLNFVAVMACYVFLIFGLNYFILKPERTVLDAFWFGLVINGVYETTTMASFKKWKLRNAVIDILWGGVLFSLTTYLTRTISTRFI